MQNTIVVFGHVFSRVGYSGSETDSHNSKLISEIGVISIG